MNNYQNLDTYISSIFHILLNNIKNKIFFIFEIKYKQKKFCQKLKIIISK